jgi:hypothetical protein
MTKQEVDVNAAPRILVVGAGPAGLRAAITLAKAGLRTVLVDHATGIGGAVYATLRGSEQKHVAHAKEAKSLKADFDRYASEIDLRCSTSFSGLDYKGTALLTGKSGLIFKPHAVIFATGAREKVRPRPGWTLAGVTTAGAIQIGLKTSGNLPPHRLLLAGSGPLLYAIGAQLTRVGRPPVAILESGHPFRNARYALTLPPKLLIEAANYMLRLRAAGVPVLTGTDVRQITRVDECLIASTTHSGRYATIRVDQVGLHDGLAPNDYGLDTYCTGTPVFYAGDCDRILGRYAAEESGVRAAEQVIASLHGRKVQLPALSPHYERAQTRLARIFQREPQPKSHTGLADLPDETVICRCENRSLGEIRRSLSKSTVTGPATGRSLRLAERVGMGSCQGRQCLDWVAELSPQNANFSDLRGSRWPLKPTRIRDILAAPDETQTDSSLEKQ